MKLDDADKDFPKKPESQAETSNTRPVTTVRDILKEVKEELRSKKTIFDSFFSYDALKKLVVYVESHLMKRQAQTQLLNIVMDVVSMVKKGLDPKDRA